MSAKHLTRTLWCKKAVVDPSTGSLQQMLSHALNHGDAVDHMENTSPDIDAGSFRIIAQHYQVGKGIAGVFTSYVPGGSAVSLEIARGTKQLDLAQLRPPKSSDAGKQREWAEGLLYFFCRDDYVILIQSSTLRIGQFEEHLSWLLRPSGERVGPSIVLRDHSAKAVREKVRHSHVKSMKVGGVLMKPAPDIESSRTTKESSQISVVGTSMLDALRSALFHEGAQFNWGAALEGNLKATLVLTYNRSTTSSGQRLLDDIGLAFRDHDDVDTVLRLSNGQKLTGRELRLTTSAKIPATDGILNMDAAFYTLQSWFSDLARDGELR